MVDRLANGEGTFAKGFVKGHPVNYAPDPTFEALKMNGIEMDVPLLAKVLQSQRGRTKRDKKGVFIDEEKLRFNPPLEHPIK
jgi:hypothetical protein